MRDELAWRNIALAFTETILSEHEIPESNSILFNGVRLETLILRAKSSENHCQSCSELTGRETRCRTVEAGNALYEALPAALIRQAALLALGLPGEVPVLTNRRKPAVRAVRKSQAHHSLLRGTHGNCNGISSGYSGRQAA